MANFRAFVVTNLVLNDESESAKEKYLIRSDGNRVEMKIPYNGNDFINVYLGKEHRTSCQNAYNELL